MGSEPNTGRVVPGITAGARHRGHMPFQTVNSQKLGPIVCTSSITGNFQCYRWLVSSAVPGRLAISKPPELLTAQ